MRSGQHGAWRSRRWLLCVVGALPLISGCQNGRREIPPETRPAPLVDDPSVLRDTVGSYVLIGNGEPMRLRGFGLVVGLGDRGGRDCPTTIREYLVNFFAKEFAPAGRTRGETEISPQTLIDSMETAVVSIQGYVPPGARKGTRFDLQIQAIGTQTRSLEGGLLLPCELRIFKVSAAGTGLVEGRPLARGTGPVLTMPFRTDPDAEATRDVRRGLVLGGGRTIEERTIRLLLQEPSYSLARAIQTTLNERFGQRPPTADAMSKGYVTLHVPDEYANRVDQFIEVTTHVCLDNSPQYIERRLEELSRDLGGSVSTRNQIALIWEAMQRTVLDHIQPLYDHTDPETRYFAARTGIRLGDLLAIPAIVATAQAPDSPHALAAIAELGYAGKPLAALRLAPLLNSEDEDKRIAAYEALLNYRHPAIRTESYPNLIEPALLNFKLDLIETTGVPLIYVRMTREPRIAVFGPDLPLRTPLFYNHPDDVVTLNALNAGDEVSIRFKPVGSAVSVAKLLIEPRVADLIRALGEFPLPDRDKQIHSLGLTYSSVVEVLDGLCHSGGIRAGLVAEESVLFDLTTPTEFEIRPETDEDVDDEFVPDRDDS